MTENRRILVVDDDKPITSLLGEYLHLAGYDVDTADEGVAALRRFYAERPDVVILDIGLPGLDGWQVLKRIREVSDVPVLMLTARDSELEKVRALRAGADDYVTKPFGRQELLARIDALLRRARAARDETETYVDALLTVDFSQRLVMVQGEELRLTPREYELLAAFVRHPGRVLTHGQILELAWGLDHSADYDEVKLYVSRLRRKLAVGAPRSPIETVRGFGYRYQQPA